MTFRLVFVHFVVVAAVVVATVRDVPGDLIVPPDDEVYHSHKEFVSFGATVCRWDDHDRK